MKTIYYIVENKKEVNELKNWQEVLLFLVGAPLAVLLIWLILIIIL